MESEILGEFAVRRGSLKDDQDHHARLMHEWYVAFESEAEADGYGEWIEGFMHFDDPLEAARDRFRKTAELLAMVVALRAVDNREEVAAVEAFLRKQTYRPGESSARYTVYFCGSPLNFVEIFIDELSELDLVDIHDHFFFGDVGFVIRSPEASPRPGEIEAIEQAVLYDFHFDYGEDEISIVFDSLESCVLATVRETSLQMTD